MDEKFKAARAGDRPQEPKQQQLVNREDPLDEGWCSNFTLDLHFSFLLLITS